MFILKLLLVALSYNGVYGQGPAKLPPPMRDLDTFFMILEGKRADGFPDGKTCNDCIQFPKCPRAFERVTKERTVETAQLFKNALCGYEYNSQLRIPMVCCSDFSTPVSGDAIETHPNLKLLPETCGKINGDRIIGGTIAGIHEYPWMALVSYKTADGLTFGCGASIISSRYILTAAHCVQNKNIPGVRIGEYDIRYATDCQGEPPNFFCESHLQVSKGITSHPRLAEDIKLHNMIGGKPIDNWDIRVEEKIVHPDYKVMPTVQNDIALLRLAKQIDFSYNNSKPICLPISQELRKPLKDGERAEVAGWGVTEAQTDSSVLLKVNIPILTSESCMQLYNTSQTILKNILTEKEFCAGELNKDSCSGDSGGPLMVQKEYNGAHCMVQYGVVSRGPRQCGIKNPGIYTDVTKYLDWILDNIKQ